MNQTLAGRVALVAGWVRPEPRSMR